MFNSKNVNNGAAGEGFYDHLSHFLLSSDSFAYDVVWDAGGKRLRAFRFTTRLKNVHTNREKMEATTELRAIAKRARQARYGIM